MESFDGTRPIGGRSATLEPFQVIAKPAGAICNLGCEYCFYLSKESLYPGGRFRMSEGVLDAYLRQMIRSHNGRKVAIAYQGGEPTLMGLDFFRRAVALAERYRQPGQQIEHVLQTNGTLLTKEWCRFLKSHDFLVGLSVDGPRDLHDAFRRDKRGGPTFTKVMRGMRHLQDSGVRFNILCTVNAANADSPVEVYRFFRDSCGACFIQFIPIVEKRLLAADCSHGEQSVRSVTPGKWGQFLIAVFDEWLHGDVGRVFVQMFETALASWMGMPPTMCVFAEVCGRGVALEHNGDVYSCDHFVDCDHLLGNVGAIDLADLVSSPSQRSFGEAKRRALPRCCLICDVRFACNGECPKNRFARTQDGETGLNYLCAGYKAFFHHIDAPMRLMATLVNSGRQAREIMALFASAQRNEPCPCGSGQKAKRCHGR